MLWLSASARPQLTLGEYRSYQCQTAGHDQNLPPFRALTVTDNGAQAFANTLCNNRNVAQYYSSVQVSWLERDQLSARDIVEEHYDLFWSRDRRVQRLVPNFEQYYQSVLQLPNYEVYWYSLKEPPVLNRDYFYSHSIGLLEDMESNSHFLMPLAQLKSLGVDLSRTNITYFPNYYLLQQAFSRGEVDLISDGSWLPQMTSQRKVYGTLIDNASPMGQWYARINRQRAIDCDLAAALQQMLPQISGDKNSSAFANGMEACQP